MGKTLQTKCLAGRSFLVLNPEVIKVTAIKRKYIDQMHDFNITVDENVLNIEIEFIGRLPGCVIIRRGPNLEKFSVPDFILAYISAYRSLGWSADDANIKANQILDAIPQIFEA